MKGPPIRPAVPAFTILAVKAEQHLLTSLQKEARNISIRSSAQGASREDVVEHRKLNPFILSDKRMPDIWSHFALASNDSVITSHTEMLPDLGIRSPYMVVLSPDEGLLDFEQTRIPAIALTMGAPMNVSWTLPNMFVVPLALLSWSRAFWAQFRTYERTISRVSTSIISDVGHLVDMSKLDELTKVGITMASLDIQIGLFERAFGQTIEAWSKNNLSDQKELKMPSMLPWPSAPSADSESGFLSNLGNWLRRDLDAMTRAIRGLEGQVELLSGQANDAIVRKSTYEMEQVTSASEKSQQSVTTMTFILVVLTSTLITLALLDIGYLSYAVVCAAITLGITMAGFTRELPRLKWPLIEIVVVVIIFAIWPDDLSWYWIVLPASAVVGISFWLVFRGMFISSVPRKAERNNMTTNQNESPIELILGDLKARGLVDEKRKLTPKKGKWSGNFKAGILNWWSIYYNEKFSALDDNVLRFALLHEENHKTTSQNWKILTGFIVASYALLIYVYLCLKGPGHTDTVALNLAGVVMFIVSLMSFRAFETPLQEDETRADLHAAKTLIEKFSVEKPSAVATSLFKIIDELQGNNDSLPHRILRFFLGGIHPLDEERVKAIQELEELLAKGDGV